MEWQAIVTVLLVAGAGLYLAGQIRRRARGGSGGRSLPECSDGCHRCPHRKTVDDAPAGGARHDA